MLDRNGDGMVDFDEYFESTAGMMDMAAQPAMPATEEGGMAMPAMPAMDPEMMRDAMRMAFDMYDHNRDGMLDMGEYMDMAM